MGNEKKRFWKTIPGILAGVATVITTLYGVKVALQGLGVIQPKVEVPYVINMTEDEALREITEKGFTFGGATEKKTRIQEEDGKVVDQEPDPGTSMAKGQPVHIVLAKQVKVTVPLVVGKPLAAATAALETAGLKGRVRKSDKKCGQPPGLVLRQDPRGGNLPEGSSVSLDIVKTRAKKRPNVGGKGPLRILAPGQSYSQAAWALKGTGIMFGLEGDECAEGVVTVSHPLGRGTWNYTLKGGQNKDVSEFYGVGNLTVRFNSNTPSARLKLRIW